MDPIRECSPAIIMFPDESDTLKQRFVGTDPSKCPDVFIRETVTQAGNRHLRRHYPLVEQPTKDHERLTLEGEYER